MAAFLVKAAYCVAPASVDDVAQDYFAHVYFSCRLLSMSILSKRTTTKSIAQDCCAHIHSSCKLLLMRTASKCITQKFIYMLKLLHQLSRNVHCLQSTSVALICYALAATLAVSITQRCCRNADSWSQVSKCLQLHRELLPSAADSLSTSACLSAHQDKQCQSSRHAALSKHASPEDMDMCITCV